jgi:hypothetical protein
MGVLGHSDISKITLYQLPAGLSVARYVCWWLNHRVSRPTGLPSPGRSELIVKQIGLGQQLIWMALLAGSPSQESRIERESLIADDA